MTGKEFKATNFDLMLDIGIGRMARNYFGKPSAWLYSRLDGVDKAGNPVDFTPEEFKQFKGALCDLADRLRRAADTI